MTTPAPPAPARKMRRRLPPPARSADARQGRTPPLIARTPPDPPQRHFLRGRTRRARTKRPGGPARPTGPSGARRKAPGQIASSFKSKRTARGAPEGTREHSRRACAKAPAAKATQCPPARRKADCLAGLSGISSATLARKGREALRAARARPVQLDFQSFLQICTFFSAVVALHSRLAALLRGMGFCGEATSGGSPANPNPGDNE